MIFNNPERRNAVSLEMWEATERILDVFAADDEVRVVVLTGAGDKAFVSGADISQFEQRARLAGGHARLRRHHRRAFSAHLRIPKPTIAMIRGFCIGGGVGLAPAATCASAR